MNNIFVVEVGYLISRNTEMSILFSLCLKLEGSKGTKWIKRLADNGSL